MLKKCAFYGECISGDKTLIHYLPCTVPIWHSVSMYFLDGRATTISLREGKLLHSHFFLIGIVID